MADRLTRSNGRDTVAKVIEHARRELDHSGPVKFNILHVIEESGVSRSSIYHHFGNRAGLIAAVETQRLIDEMAAITETIRAVILGSDNLTQVMSIVRAVLVEAGSAAGRKQRAHRIAVMATGQNIPMLAESMKASQKHTSSHLAETFQLGIDRGILAPFDNLLGVSELIGSLFIGRVVVDIEDDPISDAAWVDAVMTILQGLLRNPDGD